MTPGPVDYFECAMIAPEARPFATGEACVFSTGCPGKDGPNEDAATLIPVGPENAVFAVADGMGGGAAGHVASRLAAHAMQSAIAAMPGDGMLRTAIIDGLEQANRSVRELAVGAGTTMVAIELNGSTIRPYNIGDSAILVIGGRGKIKYRSIAQSPTGYAIESGLLDESEAIQHEERHLVSNVIGVADMRIDIGPVIPLAQLDTVILASDGLVDNLLLDEIAAIARLRPLSRCVASLAEQATHRMNTNEAGKPSKPDDLTILGFRPGRNPKALE